MNPRDHGRPRRFRYGRVVLRTLLVVLVLVGAAGALWWRVAGTDFLYRAFFPEDARLLGETPIPDAPTAADWEADLATLGERLPALHVDFAAAFPADALPQALVEAERDLEAGADRHRMELAVVRILASGGPGTGHTMVVPLQRGLDWRMLPVAFWDFPEGLFVVTAADATLVGHELLAVGGVPAREALARVGPFIPADNDASLRFRAPQLLGLVEPLQALGMAGGDGRVELSLRAPDGATRVVELRGARLASLAGLRWGRATQSPAADAWSPADPRPRALPWRVGYDEEAGVVVARVDAMREDGEHTMAALGEELGRLAGAHPEAPVLLDLRANEGGNNELATPLADAIAARPDLDRRGRLYVAIGRRTFSAGGNLAAALERRTRAILVGEASGSRPIQYGDSVRLLLPRTRLVARVATRRWQDDLPGSRRAWLEPELAVPLGAADHFAGRDPVPPALRGHVPTPLPDPGPPPPGGTFLLSPAHRVQIDAAATPPRLTIEHLGVFAARDLFGGEGGRWVTDRAGVALVAGEEGLVLEWHGAAFPLVPAPDGHRLPWERIAAGDVRGGVAALRAAAAEVPLGSEVELVLNRLAYEWLEAGRTEEALSVFEALADLYPHAANSHDSLGDGLAAVGRTEEAIAAFRRALAIAPAWSRPARRIAELEGSDE